MTRSVLRPERRVHVLGAVALTVALGLLSACVTKSYLPGPPATSSVWYVGDSNAGAISNNMFPRPFNGAAGGSGFTSYSVTRIAEDFQNLVAAYGVPETLLVTGGVIDAKQAPTAEIIQAMEEFKSEVQALGVRLIWIVEPSFVYATQLAPLAAWQLTQPEVVDCRAVQGTSSDGIHPKDYDLFALCVDDALAALGVDFRLREPTP